MEKIIITGGAGFIGSHLADFCLEKGHHVTIIDNLSTGKRSNIPNHPHLDFIEGDICDDKLIKNTITKEHVIFHLAACVSVQKSIEDPVFSKKNNIDGFFNVLEVAREHKAQKIIFASSAAVYGNPVSFPIKEDDVTCPISPYGAEKRMAEIYLESYYHAYNLPYIAARFFNIFGPRQDPHSPYSGVISIFEERAKKGIPLYIFGDGSQTRDFVPVDRLVYALYHLGFSKEVGIYNIGTGKETNLTQLAEQILSEHQKPTNLIEYQPPREGDIQKSVADISKLKSVFPEIN